MKRLRRMTNPRVIDGQVQRKNRWDRSPNYYTMPQPFPKLDRKKPGFGYRHILKLSEVQAFLGLLPQWSELSRGLNAIVLAPGNSDYDGIHWPGVVALSAWDRDLWREVTPGWFAAHRDLFERLEIPTENKNGSILCKFTEPTIRAYQLLHVLLHELGHHHDRMTTKAQRDSCRGEDFAEQYANEFERAIWKRYVKVFGIY